MGFKGLFLGCKCFVIERFTVFRLHVDSTGGVVFIDIVFPVRIRAHPLFNGNFFGRGFYFLCPGFGFLGRDGFVRGLINGDFFKRRILLHFLLDHFGKFKPGELKQFDSLLELGCHDQLLGQCKALL